MKNDIKYSIIIPYRNREEHLQILLPIIYDRFESKNYEIIVTEQDDNEKFNKAALYNIAFNLSEGDILVFHDVDHVPTENVDYFKIENENLDVWYPVKNVIYTDLNFVNLPDNEIPGGYITHKNQVHDDHFGGVFICKKEVFKNVNGMCPLYVGWGKEDEDIRDRFLYHNHKITRANIGTFLALKHTDNCPPINDLNFITNHHIKNNMAHYLNVGYKNVKADVSIFETDFKKLKWIKSKKYEIS